MIKVLFVSAFLIIGLEGAAKNKQPQLSKVAPIEVSENAYLLAALDAQSRQKTELASSYFETLYRSTNNKEYLYNSLRMLESSNDAEKLLRVTQEAVEKNSNDLTLKRFLIVALLKNGKYAHATQEALRLSEETKSPSDYRLLADGNLKMLNYQGGCSALEKAYKITFDDEIADKIALIRYVHLGEKKEAIDFLINHIGTHGNSKVVGKRLGALYADSGDMDEAAKIFEQTFDLSQDPLVAQEAIRIYLYQKNMLKLNTLLEKSGINDPFLLDLYARDKQYEKASALAKKLYKQEQNPLYLAQSSIFSYEAAKDKNNPVLLTEVIDNLKQVNSEMENPLYLNYLGYLMIDHDLNVSEGMGYVRRALDKQPDSPFYIDSLAWGHYKLNECVEALRLIKKVESMIGSEEDEVRDHIKAIEKCKTKEKN